MINKRLGGIHKTLIIVDILFTLENCGIITVEIEEEKR